ncbi:hypothetical protein AB9F26_19560 [Falsihalocynthiibacter sp. BN13B15]|uniref:hypothetical protein n=1 Tax=Falsihalocynthiibacter sp. BN13B15 TaxID=3240871 RepID=UPI0035102EF7
MNEDINDSTGSSLGNNDTYVSMDAPDEELRRAASEAKSGETRKAEPQNERVEVQNAEVENKKLLVEAEKKIADKVFEDFVKFFELSSDDLEMATMSSDPDVQQHRIFGLVDMIGLPPNASPLNNKYKLKAALASIRDINPKDETERMFAYNHVALQNQSEGMMKTMAKGKENMLENPQSLNAYVKVQASLLKGIEALDKHRRGGKQQVLVQHVHVGPGAQAVVGDVDARKVIKETSERPMKDVVDSKQQKRTKVRNSAKPSISKG